VAVEKMWMANELAFNVAGHKYTKEAMRSIAAFGKGYMVAGSEALGPPSSTKTILRTAS
jgi:hypothetical protein